MPEILIVEDDQDFAGMLQMYLESNGFQITCVPNGAEGLRQIMQQEFDIILCDLMMPTLPGDMFYVAVERTKAHLCKRFIFMTGFGTDPKWSGFLKKVRGVVLSKPFPMNDLLIAITGVLHQTARSSERREQH